MRSADILAAVPEGDWFCKACIQLTRARKYIAYINKAAPPHWLTVKELSFGVGDFVAVFYPNRDRASVVYAVIRGIGVRSRDFNDRTAIRLQHWPEAASGYPHFAVRPDGAHAAYWEEQQEFWPLIQCLPAPPFAQGGQNYATLPYAMQERVLALAKQFTSI